MSDETEHTETEQHVQHEIEGKGESEGPMVELPDGWVEHDFSSLKLYVDPTGDLRFVYLSEYYGGEDMVSLWWFEKDANNFERVWQEFAGYQRVREELQDRLDYIERRGDTELQEQS